MVRGEGDHKGGAIGMIFCGTGKGGFFGEVGIERSF